MDTRSDKIREALSDPEMRQRLAEALLGPVMERLERRRFEAAVRMQYPPDPLGKV